ncbi:MAG TPA: lytic murein transglycosylase [Solirubrobacterales bacterium]|nr:lytic murein transglycosylase [Solirubrobacterales bacterium]
MAKRFLIIIALGTTLAVLGAGTASSLKVGVGDLTVTTPTLPAPVPNPPDVTVQTPKLPNVGGGGDGGGGLLGGGSSGGGGSASGGSGTSSSGSSESSSLGSSVSTGAGATGGGNSGKEGSKGGKGLFSKQKGKRQSRKDVVMDQQNGITQPVLRQPDGSPTPQDPGLTTASFGPAPIGVPNPVIDSFEIPPFLLPIYQSCGTEYGIPWQVLASINKIETAFGTNLNISSAGAMGWMQFIPSTWAAYGVDANDDGRRDPYNPVDAICAAARYLKAAGGDHDVRQAIFAYNHADWYVDEVLLNANQYGRLPDALVGSLTGLTEGAHFPVAAKARYADDISDAAAIARSTTQRRAAGNAADVIQSNAERRSINVYSDAGSPVVAVNDGTIKKLGQSKDLGKFIVLQDAYGNRYTYSHLGEIATVHPVPREKKLGASDFKLQGPSRDAAPKAPATKGESARPSPRPSTSAPQARQRLYALPDRADSGQQPAPFNQTDPLAGQTTAQGDETFKFDPKTMELKPLKVGSKVIGGSMLGRVGKTDRQPAHLNFAIRPAGRGAPTIDPKPILDGWKLLETTAIYRANDRDPFSANPTVGQVLLMSKAALEQRVLHDPKLSIYACGRQDVASGQIDRRILAVMEYLVAKGYRLTITALKCGHSYLTSSGNVSAHSYGAAVDIAAVNGIPITGHQGPGTITEAVIKDLLLLQGAMRPAQIISLMDLGPPTFILPDHYNHIHVGYTFSTTEHISQLGQMLKPEQWQRLIERLGQIENPKVPAKPSVAALPAKGAKPSGD